MTDKKKIDPTKAPPPQPRDACEREFYRIADEIQKLILRHPEHAKKIVYGLLGNAIACADTVGIDVDEFVRGVREQFVKTPPLVFIDGAGWKPES